MTIEVVNISKAYDGKTVLKDFSMLISDESAYAVTGPDGSGKTTLLKLILGMIKPDSGQINLLGDYKYDRVNAGVVFEEDRLCENFSTVENVAMVNAKLSARVAREELEKLLPADVLDLPVRRLSPVMRRKVCIVRACIIPSDVLVLDEPFKGLSAEERDQAIRYIREAAAKTPIVISAKSGEGLGFCKTVQMC